MTASDRANIWVLLGPHKGDNNQVLALAEGLGMPFRTIPLRFRWFGHLPAVLRSVTLSSLPAEVCAEIAPPWPALVLGIGQRSVPIARYIQRQSGGRAKIVRLGDPMVSPHLFDLVITTTQYAVRDDPNVLRLPVTITNRDETPPNKMETRWLDQFARPLRLMVIGGATSLWRFPVGVVTEAATMLLDRARREGGSVLAISSPRTSPALLQAAKAALGDGQVVEGPFPRYGALLAAADEVHVTGDSVSMLSDAIASGKPVGLIPLKLNTLARGLDLAGSLRGRPFRLRDLRKFWADLTTRGLVGTISEPRHGDLDEPALEIAVAAIRRLIDEPVVELAQAVRRTAIGARVAAATAAQSSG